MESLLNLALPDEQIILLNQYSSYFHNPIIATTVIIIYMIFGFSVLVALLSHINNKYGYKKMVLAAVIVYMMTFIGFKTQIKTLIPFICFNNYILLHHSLFVNGSASFIGLLLSGVVILGFCLGKIKIINKINFGTFVLSPKEKIISILFPVVLLSIESLKGLVEFDFNLRNVIITTFLGVSQYSSTFISWIKLTSLYMIPLFFIGVSSSRIKTFAQAPIVIRYKNKYDFEYRITMEYFKYIILYTFVLVVIGNMLYSLEPALFQSKDYLFEMFQVEFTSKILNIYFIVFFVNLLFDFVFFMTISKYLSNVAATVLILVFKFIFYLLPKINYLYLNFGILNLYEKIEFAQHLLLKLFIMLVGIVGYFGVMIIRRYKYVNN
ncbi:MAG: hypothetical protein Q4A29_02095 [Eubacteriales bacterium]|nr:hypothetical protein [Eubacteriales bacterium]